MGFHGVAIQARIMNGNRMACSLEAPRSNRPATQCGGVCGSRGGED